MKIKRRNGIINGNRVNMIRILDGVWTCAEDKEDGR